MDRYRALTREHAEIDPVVARFGELQRAERDLATADEFARDPGMKEFAEEERAGALARMAALEDGPAEDAAAEVIPTTSATCSWKSAPAPAATSRRCSRATCSACTRATPSASGWQVELVSASPSELGGYKEAIVRIVGSGAYSKLKFESGGHRVQRVPETEAQGRIHTSACTVAVLPEADPVADVTINPADLRIDTFRASGAGGQHINKTDSAVRITHLPTGTRRRVPGRPLAAPQPRVGDGGAGVAAGRPRAPRAAAEGGVDAQEPDRLAAIAASASAPTISRRAASPTTGST